MYIYTYACLPVCCKLNPAHTKIIASLTADCSSTGNRPQVYLPN